MTGYKNDMNNFRKLFSAAIIVNAFFVSSAHALVVDFEEYDQIGLQNNFLGNNINLNTANLTHRLIGQSFGNNDGITFSGGVMLQNPLNSDGESIVGDGESIYYGTAFSPATSITTANYSSTLSIDITSAEMVTNVSGSFVHGLDTTLVGPDELVNYFVEYYVEGIVDPFREALGGQLFVDGADVVSFSINTLGAYINRVELSAVGFDFPSTRLPEWDFLLSSVSFNEASPVPLPAALPLFMSALFGGFVAARRKKPSDHKVSS